jgi:hypothetical protein
LADETPSGVGVAKNNFSKIRLLTGRAFCTLVLSRVLKTKMRTAARSLLIKTVTRVVGEINEGTYNMKAIVVAALLALSFTTGFTCSKNQPETTTTTETTTTEAVAPATEATPAEGTVAPTEAAPAASPAAPAGETH